MNKVSAPIIDVTDLCRVHPDDVVTRVQNKQGEDVLVVASDEIRLRWRMAVRNGLMVAAAALADKLYEQGPLAHFPAGSFTYPLSLQAHVEHSGCQLSFTWQLCDLSLWAFVTGQEAPIFCGTVQGHQPKNLFYIYQDTANLLLAAPVQLFQVTRHLSKSTATIYDPEEVIAQTTRYEVCPADEDGPSRIVLYDLQE